MENYEFDNALRDFVNKSELPYDAGQWEKMAQRLKAHERQKVIPLVEQPKKVIPIYKWAGAAAAACLLVMLGWYIKGLQTDSAETIAKKTNTTINTTQDVTNTTTVPVEETPTTTAAETRAARAPEGPTRPGRTAIARSQTEKSISSVVAATLPADTMTKQTRDEQPVVQAQPNVEKPRMIDRVLPSYDLPQEEEQKQLERKMAYGVNGGYNLGKGEGNFTVGVNVRRKLSKRLALETGIAYVSGSNTSHQEMVETSNLAAPGAPSGFNVTSVTYEPVKNSVHYLQAAPSLNYQVLPGFSAGGGVDAQRLLTKASKAISTNNIGEPESAQPQWDFGVTARMDYQVIKRLKAGVMYRESVGAVSKQASQTAKRNYLLMQLSYTIF